MDSLITMEFIASGVVATVRMATPLLLVALGETLAERSGVLNLGVEGIIQVGALASFVAVVFTNNLWFGLLAGLIAGATLGLLMAFFSVTLRTDQVVTGIAIWIFGWGMASFLYRVFFGIHPTPVRIEGLESVKIPLLSQIPLIGAGLFNQNILTYIAFICVPLTTILLFKTAFGLNIRTVGENPRVADSLGVNVYLVRYICVIVGGIFAALAGIYLSMGQFYTFVDNVSGGRGFIAIALVMFGKWKPHRVLAGAFLFGAFDALQQRLQALYAWAVPFHLLLMLPYLLTIIILVVIIRQAGIPKSLCIPYKREAG